jgi:hypothetical protein
MAKASTKDYEDDEPKAKSAAKAEEKVESKLKAGGHIAPADMRKEVAGKPLEDLSADIDSARAPYPHGSPRDPADIFEEGHGYRKAE